MSRIPVIAYGVVARVPRQPNPFVNIRKHLRQGWDRLTTRWGSGKIVDYRNHIDTGTYNRGDFAIMQASLQAIGRANGHLHPMPTDWETLNGVDTNPGAMVICGSGYFSPDAQMRFPARLHSDLSFIKAQNIPVIVYGAGVNFVDASQTLGAPRVPDAQRAFLSDFLAQCTHVSVRDETSRGILQSCTSTPVKLIGDPALFIDPIRPPFVRLPLAHGPRVGINIPFHGPAANQRVTSDLPLYTATLKRIQAETGCHFYFMVHYDTEVLIAQLLQDAGVQMTVVNGDVDTLLGVYGQLNLHIGGMLHSCILSASTGTPCIGLAYDIKHAGFFDLMGMPEYCVPAQPFDMEKVLSLMHAALNDAPQLRERIQQRRSSLATLATDFLQEALAHVGTESA